MNKSIVVSVMAGIAAFGVVLYAVRNFLPGGNVVTDTIKKGASIAATK